MPSWRTGRSEHRWLAGRRRLVLAAGAGVALVGAIAGAAAAGVTSAPAVSAPASDTRHGRPGTARTTDAARAEHPRAHAARADDAARAEHPRAHAARADDAARADRARAVHTVRKVTGLATSCRSVAHVGDSTTVDLISPADLPNPAQRLPARYAAVGVKHLNMDASGGRSIVEALPGQVNGYNVARARRAAGHRGCWVFALGTNDAANVANGSAVGDAARINEMMSVADGQPVMWVNTVTATSSGFWANANEQAWDQALVNAAARYPNMRIFDWAAVAQPSWFLPDGIHYTPFGCAMRAKAIADALARAFPANGRSKGDIVK